MNAVDALEQLAASRERFLKFVRSSVSNNDLAEDIVQASLTKAVERFGSLKDEERLVPWFFAILRNTITDTYRRHLQARETELVAEFDIAEEQEVERRLCECFAELLPVLKAEYAELIESIDLRSEEPGSIAQRLGVTPNNLKVRHHRARQALKRRLEETCRVCAQHHCLDCTCQRGQV
jgi:RNA polymerase sigma-70 factor (ECF subfamily)